jgi:hypothetical protein
MEAFEILSAGGEVRHEAANPVVAAEGSRVKRRPMRQLSIRDYVRLLLPFLVLGLLGAVAKLKYPYWWPGTDLVYFLADALLVAMVIGVVLELTAAKPLVEKVSENVAQKLIGRGLPAELQARIKDIVGTGVVRDHYVKSYTFSPPEDGRVVLDVEIRFEVRNYSDAMLDYAPEFTGETFWQPEFRFLEYGIAGKKIHTFAEDNLFSKVETANDIHVKRVPSYLLPKVTLSPVAADRKAVCQVTWRYRVTMPEQYCDTTDFGEATLGATVQLQQLPEELKFVSGGDDSLHHESASHSWFFDRPFIPGQHVQVWWFPKKSR